MERVSTSAPQMYLPSTNKAIPKLRRKSRPGLEPLLLRYKPCKPATKLEWLPQYGDLQDLRSRFGFQVPMSAEYLPPKPPSCKPVSVRTRSVVQYLQNLCQKQTEYQRSVFSDPQEKMMELAVDRNSPWYVFNTEKRRMQSEAKKNTDPPVTKQDWTEFHGLFPSCCDESKKDAKARLYGLKKKKPPSQYKASMKLAEAWSRRLSKISNDLQRFGKHDIHCALVRMSKIRINQEHQNKCFELLRNYEEMTDPRRLSTKNADMKKFIEHRQTLSKKILEATEMPVINELSSETSEAHVPRLVVFYDENPNAHNGRQPCRSSGNDGESCRDDEFAQILDRDGNSIVRFY